MTKKSPRNKPNGQAMPVMEKVAEPEIVTISSPTSKPSSPSNTVLEAHGVHKTYSSAEVLHGIDFTLAEGERVALIGPNGAGKSTLLQCLAGWLPMDEGEVTICGASLTRDEQKARSSLVFLPDTPNFYQSLTAWDHMLMVGRFHDMIDVEPASEYLLHSLGLWGVRKSYPSTYSRGMKYKLGLALGLLINPKVILLDEPTAALDPLSARVMWRMLDEFQAEDNGAVLLSSHQVELATPGIGRFFLLINGNKIGDSTPQGWIERYHLPSTATVASVFTAAIDEFAKAHPEATGEDL
ncbi:MAG: ABC transporter ATP-binding protein [Chloroflexota bacterium]